MLIAFHLGRVYTLSLAELLAVFEQKGVVFQITEFFKETLIIKTQQELDFESLQRRLGGVVKIMEVVDILPRKKSSDYLSYTVKEYFHPNILKSHYLKESTGKIVFGLSVYPLSEKLRLFGQNKRIGMNIKKQLQTAGISCRLVIPEGSSLALPSVAVGNNQILEKGVEIDLLATDKKVYIAKTKTVQDFADYGRRDYQRPARDMRVGMIPPKVAQIMINLGRFAESVKSGEEMILDPFCGTGTILQEAMLMGYKVFGSDISEKAIEAAEKNLSWFRNRYKLPLHRYELIQTDAKILSEKVKEKKFAGVITEGTLGPNYTQPPEEKEIKKNFEELSKLYQTVFKELKAVLQPLSRVVIALPAYQRKNGYISFPHLDNILKLGYIILDPLPKDFKEKYPFLKLTPRNSIIYERKDQIVVREIIIFRVT